MQTYKIGQLNWQHFLDYVDECSDLDDAVIQHFDLKIAYVKSKTNIEETIEIAEYTNLDFEFDPDFAEFQPVNTYIRNLNDPQKKVISKIGYKLNDVLKEKLQSGYYLNLRSTVNRIIINTHPYEEDPKKSVMFIIDNHKIESVSTLSLIKPLRDNEIKNIITIRPAGSQDGWGIPDIDVEETVVHDLVKKISKYATISSIGDIQDEFMAYKHANNKEDCNKIFGF